MSVIPAAATSAAASEPAERSEARRRRDSEPGCRCAMASIDGRVVTTTFRYEALTNTHYLMERKEPARWA